MRFVPSAVSIADAKKRLASQTGKILRLKAEIGQKFWDLGKCLVDVQDSELFIAAGHTNFEHYLRHDVAIGRTSAYQLMRLARNFSRSIAMRHGQEKLMAAITYAEATPEEDRPIDVLRYELNVRAEDGKLVKTSFAKVTANQLKSAAARLRRKRKQETAPSAPMASFNPRLLAFQKRAKQALGPNMKLEIKAKGRAADPEVELKLSGLHLSKLAQALEVLAEVGDEH